MFRDKIIEDTTFLEVEEVKVKENCIEIVAEEHLGHNSEIYNYVPRYHRYTFSISRGLIKELVDELKGGKE